MDVDRLDGLWRAHAAQVRAYAARRVGLSAADDVVADVYVAAMRHPERIPDPALPYLYGIAWKVVANHHRKRARHVAGDRRLGQPIEDDAYTEADLRSSVQRALLSMSPGDAEAVRLVAWEDLTSEDAARVLGCTPAAFRMTLSRARQRLRKLMEDDHVTRR